MTKMADPKGFLKHGREVATRRSVEERVNDWDEVYPDGIGESKLTAALIEKKIGVAGTARNWNTAQKLATALEAGG